jgi:hypothetical protein
MSLPIAILLLLLAALVVSLISAPLRAASRRTDVDAGGEQPSAGHDGPDDPPLERDDLEAAREAKYREIRDAELDYRTGKLSRADYEAIDTDLRAEALEILNRLERFESGGAKSS